MDEDSAQAAEAAKNVTGKYVAGRAARTKVARRGTAIAAKGLRRFGGNLGKNAAKGLVKGVSKLATGAATGGLAIAASIAYDAKKEIGQAIGGIGTLFLAAPGMFAASIGSGWTTFGIALVVTPLVVGSFLVIINTGAYIVPPTSGFSVPIDGGGPLYESCAGANAPKPEAVGVRYSADGRYAMPVAPYDEMYWTCGHWDGGYATDMGVIGVERGAQLPVIAYTSGIISGISQNDSLGGKYIILSGNDGRHYYYAHNCSLYVTNGQSVKAGDVIATTDNSGSAASSVEHLHFAIANSPNFVYGGTVCPARDFEQKFATGRCSVENFCP